MPYAAVKKVTLIVSNSFEYDHQYFNGHLKISWHELESVMNALPPLLTFELKHRAQSTPVQDIPEPTPAILDQYRLFPDDTPSVDQMLVCIEQSRYWELVLGEPMKPTPVFTVKPGCLS